jgi:hypothetical protein
VSEEERQPPRFQDTTERAALPLPLPGSEEPAPIEDPSPDGSESTTDETAAVPPPPPAAEPDEPPLDPLFAPPAAEAFGTGAAAGGGDAHPEIMVGAAFLGGVGLALLVKRLGS